MNTPITYATHFEYAQALHCGAQLGCLSWVGWRERGPADAVGMLLSSRPQAVCLKVTSVAGEVIGLAPGGLAA